MLEAVAETAPTSGTATQGKSPKSSPRIRSQEQRRFIITIPPIKDIYLHTKYIPSIPFPQNSVKKYLSSPPGFPTFFHSPRSSYPPTFPSSHLLLFPHYFLPPHSLTTPQPYLSLPTPTLSLPPSIDAHRTLGSPPSIDAHQALGSPSGRAGAKRLRGLTAPIPPTNYPQTHPTDSSHELHPSPHCLHIPLPLPSGGTSPGGRGKSRVQT